MNCPTSKAFIGSAIICIVNIIVGLTDFNLMVQSYSKLEALSVIQNVFIFLSIALILLQFLLGYGLCMKKPKIVMTWIILEAIRIVVRYFAS